MNLPGQTFHAQNENFKPSLSCRSSLRSSPVSSSIVVKDADTEVSESQSIEPHAVEDPDYAANISHEFVEDVDVECGPEEGIEERGGLEDVTNHGGGRGMVV